MFLLLSLALENELFLLSVLSFPTGRVLTDALWVKLSDVFMQRRKTEREREDRGRLQIKSDEQTLRKKENDS